MGGKKRKGPKRPKQSNRQTNKPSTASSQTRQQVDEELCTIDDHDYENENSYENENILIHADAQTGAQTNEQTHVVAATSSTSNGTSEARQPVEEEMCVIDEYDYEMENILENDVYGKLLFGDGYNSSQQFRLDSDTNGEHSVQI